MEIALTPEAERFVQAQLKSGHFRDASELVNAALRNFIDRSQSRSRIDRRTPKTMEELEALLLESCESLDRGEGIEGDKAYAILKERLSGC